MDKVALIIGHNSRNKGAYSIILGSEYTYWKRIAEKIKTVIPQIVDVYERKANKCYTKEMNEVLEELNKNDYKFCLELHFNASTDSQANGCECYIYHKNNKAKELASYIMAILQNKFNSKIRSNHGINLINSSKVRGGYGICKSKDTYILIEPFFGTNEDESLRFSIEKDVADLFINFIKEKIKEG